jgi:hypothetical protein
MTPTCPWTRGRLRFTETLGECVGADDCTLCVARTRKERNLRGEFTLTPVQTSTD